MQYHVHPGKPNNESDASNDAQTKQCHDCLGLYPLSYFGLAKYSKDGISHICFECNKQFQRVRRRKKYNAKSPKGARSNIDDITRSVRIQNTNIIQSCIFQSRTIDICGFIPSTQATFHIQFGRNRYDLESMAVYDNLGNSYFEVVYSGIAPDKVISQLLANLKEHNIRLERSEGDIVLAKRVVYYING